MLRVIGNSFMLKALTKSFAFPAGLAVKLKGHMDVYFRTAIDVVALIHTFNRFCYSAAYGTLYCSLSGRNS